MARTIRPAVAKALASLSGVTRDGQPMSYNRAPSPDVAPWIARLYVTKVDAPTDFRLDCGLFNDTSFIRIQLAGDWRAETARGPMHLGREALFFGAQTRRMPISVTGRFISVGLALRPGTCHALKGPKACDHLDCIAMYDEFGGSGAELIDRLEPDASPEDWLQVLENEMRAMINWRGAQEPDPVTARFEAAAYSDPTISVSQLASDIGIDQRRLERIVRRDFGLPPKQFLRRARALDMASHLRGVADHDEAEALALRYYDQSHLIREFIELFGMSPSQFVSTPQPLMTLALETRQARRLEMMERIAPGDIRPWE